MNTVLETNLGEQVLQRCNFKQRGTPMISPRTQSIAGHSWLLVI